MDVLKKFLNVALLLVATNVDGQDYQQKNFTGTEMPYLDTDEAGSSWICFDRRLFEERNGARVYIQPGPGSFRVARMRTVESRAVVVSYYQVTIGGAGPAPTPTPTPAPPIDPTRPIPNTMQLGKLAFDTAVEANDPGMCLLLVNAWNSTAAMLASDTSGAAMDRAAQHLHSEHERLLNGRSMWTKYRADVAKAVNDSQAKMQGWTAADWRSACAEVSSALKIAAEVPVRRSARGR